MRLIDSSRLGAQVFISIITVWLIISMPNFFTVITSVLRHYPLSVFDKSYPLIVTHIKKSIIMS